MASYVSRLLEQDLRELGVKSDPTGMFDLVDEGEETDIARNKDQMIGDAVLAEHFSETASASRS